MPVSQGEDRYHQQQARIEQGCGIAPGAASVRVWQIALGVAGDAGGARRVPRGHVASVAYALFPENIARLELHERCGFRVVGVYERHGRLEGSGATARSWNAARGPSL